MVSTISDSSHSDELVAAGAYETLVIIGRCAAIANGARVFTLYERHIDRKGTGKIQRRTENIWCGAVRRQCIHRSNGLAVILKQ